MALDIKRIQELLSSGGIKWSRHALKRMRERKISVDDFSNCIASGEIIEQYPDSHYHPSCLILGVSVNGKYLHVVIGCDNVYVYAVTAYYPDPNEWELDMKTRKGH